MTIPALGSYAVLVPLAFACTWGVVLVVAEMFSTSPRFTAVGWLSLVGLALTAAAPWLTGSGFGLFGSAISLDAYSGFFGVVLCALAGVAVLMSMDFLPATGIAVGEAYPLMFFAVAGLMVMAAATDLIVLFLGLEIMSMAAYVLAGLQRGQARSNEAALKYFLLGAFASAFLLYGIAILYGETGTTSLGGIAQVLVGERAHSAVALIGAGLVLVGFGFKIAAVPFHLWTPDVYEGSPSSVTVFMMTSVKAGAFAAVVKVLLVALAGMAHQLHAVLWAAAIVTMTVGNVVALRQTSFKRMLAYSSIAHTGYLLVGITAGGGEAGAAVLFYLVVYGAMNLGAFGIMMLLADSDTRAERIEDLAGLGRRRPMLAAAMTVCMLSLTGIPPLGGFMAKLYLFLAALRAGEVGLVVVALGNSVLAAAYYLGVVRCMYFDDGGLEPQAGRPYLRVGVAASVVAVVVLGIMPSGLLAAAGHAFSSIALGP